MPLAGHGNWGPADAERLDRDFGFPAWEPPDAGENTDPAGFGGGTAGVAKRIRRGLHAPGRALPRAADLPEPLCYRLAGHPHDVLGYPRPMPRAATARAVRRPAHRPAVTVDEDLRDKPTRTRC